MNVKISLVALSAMILGVIFAAPSAQAKEADTEKSKESHTVVTVEPGDTLSAIADKHDTTYARIFDANKDIANPDVIDVGDKIRIPKKDEKLPKRFEEFQAATVQVAPPVAPAINTATTTYTAPVASAAAPAPSVTYRASSAGNTYAWGNCTWYAKNKRPDLPNMLGNGGSWTANAAAQGYRVGYTPRAGAIAEIPGHVMYVESVNANGTINISEMNYNGGIGVVNYRTISASGVSFIY